MPELAEKLRADDQRHLDNYISRAGDNQSDGEVDATSFGDIDLDQFSIDNSVFSALDNISDDWFGPFLADLIC
jgi:hypothetical protein